MRDARLHDAGVRGRRCGCSGCWDNLHRAHRATTKKSIAYDIVVITHAVLSATRLSRGCSQSLITIHLSMG